MKTQAILALATFFSLRVFSQDMIYMNDGRSISAKVKEVGITEIKYKNYSNQDGPLYVVNKSDVGSIKYENGTEESFAAGTNLSNKVNGYNTADPNAVASNTTSGYSSSNYSSNCNNNGYYAKPRINVVVGTGMYYRPWPRNYYYSYHPYKRMNYGCGHRGNGRWR